MARAKKNPKLERPIPDIAHVLANQLIAGYGIADAERIAKLVWEKIVASRKGLERKYGKNRK